MKEDFSMESFQEKVSFEFHLLKALKMQRNMQSKDAKRNFQDNWGCFFIPLHTIAGKIGEKLLVKEGAKRDHEKFESEANDLLADDKIGQLICESLQRKSQKEIITEEKFVKIVTESLLGVIPLEPALFASIAFKISEVGMENFCNEIIDEK